METPSHTRFTSLLFLVMIIFGFLVACSGDGAEPEFVPGIGANWRDSEDAANSKHSIVWQYDPDVSGCPDRKPCFNTGYFTGFDFYNPTPGQGSSQCNLSGSFENHHIEWFYPEDFSNSGCPLKGVHFSGTIDDSSAVITASSSKLGDLRLQKFQ